MSVKWNFSCVEWKTMERAAEWAAVEKLQELTNFIVSNQVLQCSTRATLDAILSELRGLRRDLRRKKKGKIK